VGAWSIDDQKRLHHHPDGCYRYDRISGGDRRSGTALAHVIASGI
jgi:hypothetical protein